MAQFYRSIDVWQRISGERLARYRCFETIPGHKYCVQSKEFFSVPPGREELRQLEEQFFILLSESAPDERSPVFDTLEEAIRRHDLEFEE
jgi:hypothetical protein